jgi:sirohydrochlorin cobaltochelatase
VDAIILFSHGSVLCGAERNLLALAGQMRAAGDAPIVEVGFLNYTEPSFASAVESCVAQGATRIIVAPYFLVAGKFVTRELPGEIEKVRADYPNTEFVIADVIGFHPALADAILASAAGARPPAEHTEALREAAAWCREDPTCPLFGSEVCRVKREVAK